MESAANMEVMGSVANVEVLGAMEAEANVGGVWGRQPTWGSWRRQLDFNHVSLSTTLLTFQHLPAALPKKTKLWTFFM